MKKSSPRHDSTHHAAQRHLSLSRRHFLRGLGVTLALPALPSLSGLTRARAATPASALSGAATTASGAPLRMAFVYFPNGAIQPNWWPEGQGTEFELSPTLSPLQSIKQKLQILGGLDHVNATPGPDGAGDHARASGTFLTGVRVRKTAGADILAGVSIDQIVARQIGHLTRFPSLELTCDSVRKSGSCDSGYSCAYQYNLSWSTPTTPVAPEPNPRLVFERLFGEGSREDRQANLARRRQQQRSILDFILEDTRRLERQINAGDKAKLDQYLTSVREVERRIEAAERFPDTPNPNRDAPEGIPASFEDHIKLMFDMMALAFATDSTRVGTFLLANEGSNRAFPEIGIAEGHHYLTHHRNQEDMVSKVAEIDRWYVSHLARFLEKLDGMEDSDGRSVLDNSMIVYGSGNADGNRHTHTNLPVLLAGGGGGAVTPGRHVHMGDVPMSNFLLSLADRMGAQDIDQLGDSTGRVSGI